jgi:hypothetical protein
MDDDEKRIAGGVHALLMNARPHTDDINIARASELASSAVPSSSADGERAAVVAAIEKLRVSIGGGASAAEAERLLLDATYLAERWFGSFQQRRH